MRPRTTVCQAPSSIDGKLPGRSSVPTSIRRIMKSGMRRQPKKGDRDHPAGLVRCVLGVGTLIRRRAAEAEARARSHRPRDSPAPHRRPPPPRSQRLPFRESPYGGPPALPGRFRLGCADRSSLRPTAASRLCRSPATSSLPPVVPVRPRPGDWLLAVARDAAGEPVFAYGLFEGIARERCGAKSTTPFTSPPRSPQA